MAGSRQAFQNNPELQRFVLRRVRTTGRQLGVGSYGSVEELEMNGLVCAGKRLHEVLLEQGNAGVAEISRKYLLECQVMAEMRHPHIVQFLGLCFLEGSALPVLVMERLDSSLDDLLETSPGLPPALKQSLLTDVAQGLVYLHTHDPPVVHRDLSARNVLLTSSLVAKISDLGNARIVNLQPGQLARTLTRVPGTLAYMPPESFDQHSQYGPRLDIFSFGHLALFTLTQVFPGTLLPHTYEDPDNPGHLLGRSEVERRTDYIQPLREQLGEQHPLLQLVCQCLHNTPAQRPSAEELLQQLEAVRPQIKGTHSRQQVKVEMARLQVAMMSVLEAEVREKDGEIERLRRDLQQVQALVEAKDAQLRQNDTHLQQQDAELRERILQLNRQLTEVQTLREERGSLQTEVETKDAEINRQQRELETLISKISHLQQQAQEKDSEVQRQQRELQTLRAEMDSRIAQIQRQLRERDYEINRLQRELRDQTTSTEESAATVQSPPQKSVAAVQLTEDEHKNVTYGNTDSMELSTPHTNKSLVGGPTAPPRTNATYENIPQKQNGKQPPSPPQESKKPPPVKPHCPVAKRRSTDREKEKEQDGSTSSTNKPSAAPSVKHKPCNPVTPSPPNRPVSPLQKSNHPARSPSPHHPPFQTSTPVKEDKEASKTSILDTIMSIVGDLSDDEPDEGLAHLPPPPPTKKELDLSDEIPPIIPRRTAASLKLVNDSSKVDVPTGGPPKSTSNNDVSCGVFETPTPFSMPVAKTEPSKATAFGNSLGSSLAPLGTTGSGSSLSAQFSLATIPQSSPSPHHPPRRSLVRGNILGFLRKKDKTHPLSELTWRRLPDMPRVMRLPQSVTVDTAVYIADSRGVILRYDLHSQQWMEPLQYQYWYCGMTTVRSQLVMIGGRASTHKTTNTVSVWCTSQRSWTHPYPPLNTPCFSPAVSTYHQRLVVAGGTDASGTDLATVEILDTSVSHSQWLSATGLPVSCSRMSAAITHGMLYLLGGSLGKKVLSVSLAALTQNDKLLAQWRILSDAPLEYSTTIAVHGSLLAVGGSHGGERSSAIHVYNQEKNAWNKVDDLPTEREDCACCLLPSGEILVAGGYDRNGSTRRMDAAAVKD